MPVNYHNHTTRCGHATGTMSEYLDRALELGITEFGFADHAPIAKEYRENITMEPEETEDYIADVLHHQELYQDRLNLRAGFEVDFPLFPEFDKKYFTDERLDYLIGSCHFMDTWPFDHGDYVEEYEKRDLDTVYRNYYTIMLELVESRLFNIVGHLDLVKKFGHRPEHQPLDLIHAIAEKCTEYDIAVELNTAGMIKPVKEIYPSPDIVAILKEHDTPITISSDSHSPEEVGQYYDMALEMAKNTGYTTLSGFEKRQRFDIPLP